MSPTTVRALAVCAAVLSAACTTADQATRAAPSSPATGTPTTMAMASPASAPEKTEGAFDSVVITVSASTNTPSLTITVRADGLVHWDVLPLPGGRGLHPCRQEHGDKNLGAVGTTLLHDIPADVKLADLPVSSCAKPVSFRTTTTLEHQGDKSGDLSCPSSDPRTAALGRDVEAVRGAVATACQ